MAWPWAWAAMAYRLSCCALFFSLDSGVNHNSLFHKPSGRQVNMGSQIWHYLIIKIILSPASRHLGIDFNGRNYRRQCNIKYQQKSTYMGLYKISVLTFTTVPSPLFPWFCPFFVMSCFFSWMICDAYELSSYLLHSPIKENKLKARYSVAYLPKKSLKISWTRKLE